MKEKQLEKVRHDFIRYANCWEDADALIHGLKMNPGDRVLSIASAGDNSFSLLCADPEAVVAVDVNRIQLNLVELKKAAIKTLNYQEFLQFLGFAPSQERMFLYQKVKKEMPEAMTFYWEKHLKAIEDGIIYQGKFEKYFKLFRTRILPKIHTEKRINELFRIKTADEQRLFYQRHWNNLRWRLLFRIFFSKYVMGKYGRDPEFLREVKVKVSDFILNKAAVHLSSAHCQTNHFLHFIMKGYFDSEHLPHYARPENYDKIKQNIDKLIVFEGLAESALEQYSNIDKFNLSNIFEYMKPALFKEVAENLIDRGNANARYAYWNLMVPRNMHEIDARLNFDKELSVRISKTDLGFFYSNVNFDEKV